MVRKLIGTSLAGAALALTLVGPAAAQNEAGDSLVNVQISGLTVEVPIGVAANLCDINANVLAEQEREGGAACTATAIAVTTPGSQSGGGNTAGDSLVNVQIEDVEVLIPIAVAANVCDVNINVLAQQERRGGAECEATSVAQA